MDITSHVITDEENIKIVNLTSNILNQSTRFLV